LSFLILGIKTNDEQGAWEKGETRNECNKKIWTKSSEENGKSFLKIHPHLHQSSMHLAHFAIVSKNNKKK